MKERDNRGRFLTGHTPLFEGGVKKSQGPPRMTYGNYVKTLQEMLKKRKKEGDK